MRTRSKLVETAPGAPRREFVVDLEQRIVEQLLGPPPQRFHTPGPAARPWRGLAVLAVGCLMAAVMAAGRGVPWAAPAVTAAPAITPLGEAGLGPTPVASVRLLRHGSATARVPCLPTPLGQAGFVAAGTGSSVASFCGPGP
jgi:hypothetical protein